MHRCLSARSCRAIATTRFTKTMISSTSKYGSFQKTSPIVTTIHSGRREPTKRTAHCALRLLYEPLEVSSGATVTVLGCAGKSVQQTVSVSELECSSVRDSGGASAMTNSGVACTQVAVSHELGTRAELDEADATRLGLTEFSFDSHLRGIRSLATESRVEVRSLDLLLGEFDAMKKSGCENRTRVSASTRLKDNHYPNPDTLAH